MAARRREVNPFGNLDAEVDDDPGPEPAREPDPVIDLETIDDEPEPDEPAAPSRQEKRNSRTWMNREDREKLEKDRIEAQARADALAATNERLALALATVQRPQQESPRRSPIDDEIDRCSADKEALDREYNTLYQAGKLTQEDADKLRKRAVEIDNRSMDLRAQRIVQQSGVQPQNQQADAIRAYLVANFPEASQNPQALAFAEGEQRKLVAMGKPAWSVETINAAMGAAEQQFRLGRHKMGAPREPDPVLRDRFQGAPRGSTGGTPDRGGKTFTVTKEFKGMADKAFSHIKDPEKRYKHAYKMVHGQGDED